MPEGVFKTVCEPEANKLQARQQLRRAVLGAVADRRRLVRGKLGLAELEPAEISDPGHRWR